MKRLLLFHMVPIMEEICNLKSQQLMGGMENKNKKMKHPQIQNM